MPTDVPAKQAEVLVSRQLEVPEPPPPLPPPPHSLDQLRTSSSLLSAFTQKHIPVLVPTLCTVHRSVASLVAMRAGLTKSLPAAGDSEGLASFSSSVASLLTTDTGIPIGRRIVKMLDEERRGKLEGRERLAWKMMTGGAGSDSGDAILLGDLNPVELEFIRVLAEALDQQEALWAAAGEACRAIAPNMAACLQDDMALARLLAVADFSVSALARMHANQVQALGRDGAGLARTVLGLSSLGAQNAVAALPRTGIIGTVSFVTEAPRDLRARAATALAGKVTLAARTDAGGSVKDGSFGAKQREHLDAVLIKWSRPPNIARVKALPAPAAVAKKKRGGWRARALRKRIAAEAARSAAARVGFNDQSRDVDVDGRIAPGDDEELDDYEGLDDD